MRAFRIMKQLPNATYSVNALQQFCLLRRKMIVRSGKIDSAGLAQLEELIIDLNDLLRIGRSPERLDLLAGTYKAIFSFRHQLELPTQKALKNAADCYYESFELTKQQMGNTIYSLCNHLVMEHAMRLHSVAATGGKLSSKQKTEVEHALNLLSSEYDFSMANRSSELEFWDITIPAEKDICTMVLTAKEEYFKAAQQSLADAWKKGGSAHEKQTAIEYIVFLLQLFDSNKGISALLKKLKNYMEAL
jgi:hypothetical protein